MRSTWLGQDLRIAPLKAKCKPRKAQVPICLLWNNLPTSKIDFYPFFAQSGFWVILLFHQGSGVAWGRHNTAQQRQSSVFTQFLPYLMIVKSIGTLHWVILLKSYYSIWTSPTVVHYVFPSIYYKDADSMQAAFW